MSKEVRKGLIYQAISGFYYVWSQEESFATKPRGNFRHQQIKPLVGDEVEFEVDIEDEKSESRIIKILPRKNSLVRPPVANVDYALVVMSLVEPDFSYNLLDHFLVSLESNHISPYIILTKKDVLVEKRGQEAADDLINDIRQVYRTAKYPVLVKEESNQFIEQLAGHVESGIYIVMGQSGVGKSTLLNQLLPNSDIQTAEISDYLNRGRHTTREVTLYPWNDGLLADTPGFSAIEFPEVEKEQLGEYFPEIWQQSQHCRFRGCLHINEPNCAVKQAVDLNEIAVSRYQNYCQILEKIEQRKPIYRKKK
ncbi:MULTISPECIES: ribosome small subunit-dependent GTPase A [unclassified Facklamia]|uniref:ribosome small subunit-dependent GTPase A n=1 Tax=Aerococcaceae TaxID=186827 RepID=UPI0013BCBA95|nr:MULTISPECIES: ribosome small subunit-dependent GTPase A [unclassified Facklamia]NEW64081.1 ribosome small subunit-dependent GTPase A [Facklamia sp. 252]NEW67539.1 ribosome small subunit-dependent GTPase A [Facklamia sp. 253]QQD65789.1 ribosome small subunit-dependent GTPase A [Aerococcaceae bacterium zg-252]